MLTPARCPARAPARASFRASRRHARRARRADDHGGGCVPRRVVGTRADPRASRVSRLLRVWEQREHQDHEGHEGHNALGGVPCGPPRVRARVQRPRPAVHRARVRVRAARRHGKNRRRAFEIRALRDGDARRGVRRHGRAVADHPAHGNLVRARGRHAGALLARIHAGRRRRATRHAAEDLRDDAGVRRRGRRRSGAFAQRAVPGFASRGRGRVGPRPELAGVPSRGGPGVRPGDFRHQDAGRGGGGGFVRAAAAVAAPASAAAAARGAFETLLEPSGGTSGGVPGRSGTPDGDDDPELVERVAEAAFAAGFRAFAETTWGVHNAFWAPAFGSGANNDDRRVRRD